MSCIQEDGKILLLVVLLKINVASMDMLQKTVLAKHGVDCIIIN